MPVQIGSRASDFSDPTGLMSDCHRRIEMFLNTIRAAGGLNGRQLAEDERRALDAALRYFREAAPKHNADEEESLFPRLRWVSDPEVQSALADVARLEQEHRWAAPLHAAIVWDSSGFSRAGLRRTKFTPFNLPSANWIPCTAPILSSRIEFCFHSRPESSLRNRERRSLRKWRNAAI